MHPDCFASIGANDAAETTEFCVSPTQGLATMNGESGGGKPSRRQQDPARNWQSGCYQEVIKLKARGNQVWRRYLPDRYLPDVRCAKTWRALSRQVALNVQAG